MSSSPSDAFKAWHAKRAAEIIKNAEALAEEYIKNGFSDSTATRRTAIYKALETVDETGWDAWRAAQGEAQQEVNRDTERLDWLEQNLFNRENLDLRGKVCQTHLMWVMFAPRGVQGSARTIIDAAMAKEKEACEK